MSNTRKPRQQLSSSSLFSGVPINNSISVSITVFIFQADNRNHIAVSVAGVILQELELEQLRRSVVLRHGIGDVGRTLDLSHDKAATLCRCTSWILFGFFGQSFNKGSVAPHPKQARCNVGPPLPKAFFRTHHPSRNPCGPHVIFHALNGVHTHCMAQDDSRVKNCVASKNSLSHVHGSPMMSHEYSSRTSLTPMTTSVSSSWTTPWSSTSIPGASCNNTCASVARNEDYGSLARTDPLTGNEPNLLGIPDDFEVLPLSCQG